MEIDELLQALTHLSIVCLWNRTLSWNGITRTSLLLQRPGQSVWSDSILHPTASLCYVPSPLLPRSMLAISFSTYTWFKTGQNNKVEQPSRV